MLIWLSSVTFIQILEMPFAWVRCKFDSMVPKCSMFQCFNLFYYRIKCTKSKCVLSNLMFIRFSLISPELSNPDDMNALLYKEAG